MYIAIVLLGREDDYIDIYWYMIGQICKTCHLCLQSQNVIAGYFRGPLGVFIFTRHR